ncbi:MAG TPA: hypothetical protein VF148_13710 [Acidimicrobiia bacterium]
MIDSDHHEEELFEEWDLSEEDFEPLAPPPWRKPLLIAVAALTAIAMAVIPLYNVFVARPVADNGLEICGFDYCIVQEAMRESGVDLMMSDLANTFLDDDAARVLADDAADYLDIGPVELQVVDDLEGRLGGVYDPTSRSILIERPARAWTVLHEVAHAVETGHAEAYQDTLADLARWANDRSGS